MVFCIKWLLRLSVGNWQKSLPESRQSEKQSSQRKAEMRQNVLTLIWIRFRVCVCVWGGLPLINKTSGDKLIKHFIVNSSRTTTSSSPGCADCSIVWVLTAPQTLKVPKLVLLPSNDTGRHVHQRDIIKVREYGFRVNQHCCVYFPMPTSESRS